jgi:hypothetical protein
MDWTPLPKFYILCFPQSNSTTIYSVEGEWENHTPLKGNKISASKILFGKPEARLHGTASILEKITLRRIVLMQRVQCSHPTNLTSSTELK